MGTQQIDMEEFKHVVIEAFKAALQPQFDRVQRGIDKLKSAIDKRLSIIPRKQSADFSRPKDRLDIQKPSNSASELVVNEEEANPNESPASELSSCEVLGANSAGVRRLCSSSRKQSRREGEAGGELGNESSKEDSTNMLEKLPVMNSLTTIDANQLQIQVHKLGKLPLQLPELSSKHEYLVGAIEGEPSRTETMDKFLEVQGMCGDPEIDQNGGESKMPKFDSGFLDTQEFESDDTGKTADDDSSLTMGIRSEKSDGEFNSLLEKASSRIELKNGSLDIPNSDSEQRTMFVANLSCPGKLLAHCSLMIDADTGQKLLGDEGKAVIVEKGAIELDKMCREDEIFASKNMFEQPTFDPIWDRFCDDFDKRKDQALRSKLFEEGEPDMIQIGHFYKSQLLSKEAIKVGKKKGRIWLSQNPCSGYILWRHGYLNWLGGSSISRVFIVDKVSMFSMICFVKPDDVIKIVFQDLKVATSKLENCQKMAKAENCFVKPTLELNSRSMDLIRDQRLLQHETRNVYLPREGIG
ncbi:unnamed protein product [Linum trigynum]|uniref:Uncharacterized protein n=1 Tax=Linum trigynum TaxID=586398 RepID=A0AAV2GIZ1_9ROSI